MYKNHNCNDDIPLRFLEIKKFSKTHAPMFELMLDGNF